MRETRMRMRQRRHHSCRRYGDGGGCRSHGSRGYRYQIECAIRMLVAVMDQLHKCMLDRVSGESRGVHAHAQDQGP